MSGNTKVTCACGNCDFAEKNASITTEEIQQDIAATQAEINQLQSRKAMAFGTSDRLAIGRAAATRDGIEKRRDFIKKLKGVLVHRGVYDV